MTVPDDDVGAGLVDAIADLEAAMAATEGILSA
jgi:hypothetical protein